MSRMADRMQRCARQSGLSLALVLWLTGYVPATNSMQQTLTVTAGFTAEQSVAANENIALKLSRPLMAHERIAILIGATDLTDLFNRTELTLTWNATLLPLPGGETEVVAWLITADNEWQELARFPLRVTTAAQPAAPDSSTNNATSTTSNPTAPTPAKEPARRFGFDKFAVAPALNIGFKSQFAETHFPDATRPDRPTFADATLQGSIRTEMTRGALTIQSQYDIAGSSFANEALRFGQLGVNAPQIDLANYQMQLRYGRGNFTVGHNSFGALRHLINNFSSRGLSAVVPLGSRADVSLVAMNSTNVVGWSNFFGLARRRHALFGGVLGLELRKRPGALRIETGVVDAWFLSARNNFNQGSINDSERSQGWSARLLASDNAQRARLEAGFTRSRFTNPEDPLLNQGASLVPARRVTRNARYVDASYALLKDFAFSRNNATAKSGQQIETGQAPGRTLNLTLNVRHEQVDPLFRSIGASAQADLFLNQFEMVGAFGDLNLTAAHTRQNDNLADIRTILRTNTRRNAVAINTPLQGLLSPRQSSQPNPLLPRLGYSFERVSAFADFIPIGDAFSDPSFIPAQASVNQSVTAEWSFQQYRLAYRFNHSLQDNRAPGRELADLANAIHNISLGWNPLTTLDLSFDVNQESARNRAQSRTDRTLRFGVSLNWQMTRRQLWNATFSTLGAGDLARTTHSRNTEFDLQWSYRLSRESEQRLKKVQASYFVRYARRFARTLDNLFDNSSLTKLQTFNTGLNFIFF